MLLSTELRTGLAEQRCWLGGAEIRSPNPFCKDAAGSPSTSRGGALNPGRIQEELKLHQARSMLRANRASAEIRIH